MHHHVAQDERTALAALLHAGYSQRSAAQELGINQSSVSRELDRNAEAGTAYHAAHARMLARGRRIQSKAALRKIENDPSLVGRIEERLHPLVSPEVVAHDLPVSHESIYAWIYRSRPDLKMRLPQRGKKRRRYGSKREQKQGWTKDVRSIYERSAGADHRSRTRHFEGDAIRGPRSALLTLTD
jgi:IS30 family transposase